MPSIGDAFTINLMEPTGLSCALQYATRVRTIKNDVSRNEVSKDVVRLRQQVNEMENEMKNASCLDRPTGLWQGSGGNELQQTNKGATFKPTFARKETLNKVCVHGRWSFGRSAPASPPSSAPPPSCR